ncbi:MAG: metallophosphoesterase [Anaerovorax sp.]|nr:metallophosphoesterase [Anaerovorax sp.]
MLIVLFIWAFYSRMAVTRYTVYTEKLRRNQTLRVVLLADLHSRYYAEGQDKLARLIRDQKPDLIALSGDIVDDRISTQGAFSLVKRIEGCAPIFFVTGNHECCRNDLEKIKEELEKYSVKVLDDEQVIVTIYGEKIRIAGLEDPCIRKCGVTKRKWIGSKKDLFQKQEDMYSILLSHRPELFYLYDRWEFDLVLCGHTHGGLVRIPGLLNGLWAVDQGYFPKYAGGLYVHNGKTGSYTQVVSRGCAVNPNAPRVFNPPEIVVIDIKGK